MEKPPKELFVALQKQHSLEALIALYQNDDEELRLSLLKKRTWLAVLIVALVLALVALFGEVLWFVLACGFVGLYSFRKYLSIKYWILGAVDGLSDAFEQGQLWTLLEHVKSDQSYLHSALCNKLFSYGVSDRAEDQELYKYLSEKARGGM